MQKIFSILVFAAILAASLFLIQPVLAGNYGNYGLDSTMDQKSGSGNTAVAPKDALINDEPSVIIGRVIGGILALVGVVFFVLVFYGGIRWMLAQGNESEVEKAKGIIIAATLGLIIVLAAYAITAFIGQQLMGSTTAGA